MSRIAPGESESALAGIRALAREVVDFALPPRCPACGVVVDGDRRFCIACWRALDHLDSGCPRCGDPAIVAPIEGLVCGVCLADSPPYATARAAVAYGEIARAIALKLKYGGRPGLAHTIAAALDRHMIGLDDALIVPVPLHRWRIWRRGYNQAALIARALAGARKDRLRLDLLERRRATPYLRGMGADARARTVRGAFAVAARHKAALKGRTVVLIDDIYTTGATSKACARALNRAGAAEVHVRCWARVVRGDTFDL